MIATYLFKNVKLDTIGISAAKCVPTHTMVIDVDKRVPVQKTEVIL